MTLNEIISAALSELGRGHDAKNLARYRDKFTRYANDCICDLAVSLCITRRETATLSGSTLDVFRLSRPLLKLSVIMQDGFPVRYLYSEGSGIASVRAKGEVDVIYRYVPKKLVLPSDVPDIPEHLHGLIVTYVTGRERMSGDTSSQRGSDAYLSLYEVEKNRISATAQSGCEIENKW